MQRRARWLLTPLLLAAASFSASPETSTRVTLNVIAFDNHDQIVGDLTGQDFQVFDQGKPQRIVSFHRNGETTLNNAPNAPQVESPVVILFDLLSDNLSHRGHATEEIIHALEPLEVSDNLYLYLVTDQGGLEPVRGLPNAPEDNPPAERPWTRHIKPLLEIAIGKAYGLRVTYGGGTLSAIEDLGAALKPFPGRKNLIWIGDKPNGWGMPVNNPAANRLAAALDRDGITVSSVDQETVDQGVIGGIGGVHPLAQLTGGQIYTNDIEKAVKEAMAGSRSSYLIEYDAPPPDGKYHKLRVTCSRKGVRLQVKQGYYAN